MPHTYTICFGGANTSPDSTSHKAAVQTLQLISQVSQRPDVDEVTKFRNLKRRIELYFSLLKIKIRTRDLDEMSFETHFASRAGFPCDLIFDRTTIPDADIYKFDQDVDRIVFNDIISAWNSLDLDYLTDVDQTKKTVSLMHKIGAKFYLSLPTMKKLFFRQLISARLDDKTSILEFNKQFNIMCNNRINVGVFTQNVDQTVL